MIKSIYPIDSISILSVIQQEEHYFKTLMDMTDIAEVLIKLITSYASYSFIVDSASCLFFLPGQQGVLRLALMQNGLLISSSLDKTIKLWNPYIGKCLYTFNNKAVAFSIISLSMTRFASGSADDYIRIWNIQNFTLEKEFCAHSSCINCFVLLQNGSFASGSLDYTIKLWDINSLENINTIHLDNAIYNLAILPNGLLVCACGINIIILNPHTKEKIKTLKGHIFLISSLTIISADIIASGGDDKTVKLWNIVTGRCIKTFIHHSSWISGLCVIGDYLLSASDDRTIHVIDIQNYHHLRIIKDNLTSSINSLVLLPNGWVASASDLTHGVKIWGNR